MPIRNSVRGIVTVVGTGIATAALMSAVGPSQSRQASRTTPAALPAIVLTGGSFRQALGVSPVVSEGVIRVLARRLREAARG